MSGRRVLNGVGAYSILDSISIATVIIDAEGTVLFVNKEAQKLAYLTDPPLEVGESFISAIPLPWRNIAELYIAAIAETKKPATVDVPFCDPQGRKNHFEIKGSAIFSDDDQVSQIVIEARDITSQKIFENKITAVAREQSNLIEHANAVIIGTDARGYITEWNNMAAQIIGYSKNEIYTRRLLDLLPWEEFYSSFSDTMQAVISGRVITNYEAGIRDRRGNKLTFLINATPRRSTSGEVIGVLMIGQDITELWEYKRMLELKVQQRTEALHASLQKEKKLVDIRNRFVSIASHEFKMPLSGIMRNVTHLKTHHGRLPAEETLSRLENIAMQTKHMLLLLEDVLTIGKTEAGQMKANFQPVDLGTFLHGLVGEVQNGTGNTHSIRFDCRLNSLQIMSDEKLLRNIFINLLNNAIKFSPDENEVFMNVSLEGALVKVTVRDKGIGIPEKDMGVVFEPFNRGSNAQKIIGTGLGLSIVKKAMEAVDGKMEIKSRVGEGTEFTLMFRLAH